MRVRNTGDGPAKNLKVCGKGPKELVRFAGCAKRRSLAPGKTFIARVRLTVKRRAKQGRRAKVTFRTTATGTKAKTGRATVRVK